MIFIKNSVIQTIKIRHKDTKKISIIKCIPSFLLKAFYKIPIFQMLKKQSKISSPFSPIDSLKFSTFNYFGMGSVLASVAQSFWINFSAYYLNNILPAYGNVIFLVAQVSEGFGILFGWLILAKFGKPKSEQEKNGTSNTCYGNLVEGVNLYMLIYIIGAFLLVSCFPLVFLLTLKNPGLIFTFAILGKFGSGLMIISQLTIIPKITLNKNRRRKLVQKVTQYGLGGTFVSMFVMTAVSVYVNFIWKYFFGVCAFVFLGALCSIAYVYKVRELIMMSVNQPKQKTVKISNQIAEAPKTEKIIECQILKSPKFYIYALILISCALYMDIVIALFPYFVKSLNNVTHFRYLSAITVLYLSSFIVSLMTKNSFVFTGIRTIMTIGLGSSILATVLLVIGLAQNQFDFLMVIATCLIGISKIIATNCALNLINQFIGLEVKSREFIYGIYYFIQRIMAGLILYILICRVYASEQIQFLHFSVIYLPFILYSMAWVFVMVDRTLNDQVKRRSHIIIVQPNKEGRNSEEEQEEKAKSIQHQQVEGKEPISSKFADKYKKWVNKDLDSVRQIS